MRRQQQELLERAPYPETMPALTGLRVGSDGNVWVEEPRRPGDERGSLWTVFMPDGRVRASVRVPTASPSTRSGEIGCWGWPSMPTTWSTCGFTG